MLSGLTQKSRTTAKALVSQQAWPVQRIPSDSTASQPQPLPPTSDNPVDSADSDLDHEPECDNQEAVDLLSVIDQPASDREPGGSSSEVWDGCPADIFITP